MASTSLAFSIRFAVELLQLAQLLRKRHARKQRVDLLFDVFRSLRMYRRDRRQQDANDNQEN